MIGVGRALPAPPSLRTGRADLPHPALRSVVRFHGLAKQLVVLGETEEPKLLEVGIRPSEVVMTSSPAFSFRAFSQNAPQPHQYVRIDGIERSTRAVFEVLEPASQCRIHPFDDLRQCFTARAGRLLANAAAQLLLARRPRVAVVAEESVSQKVEPRPNHGVDDTCL